MRWKPTEYLHDAVSANTVGTTVNIDGARALKVYIKSANVTTGADVVVYEKAPGGADWHAVHTETVTTNGNQDVIYVPGPFDDIRLDIENRTDGDFTVSAQAL